ncbi:unnamed protein product [Paramecium pentaurelia]|uniref:Uncharacterized protein n=1 Tax=Paramecium pentaurelia TaxID=43138 RepID=A0A8S1YM95_9CILI|nr:unnamed protein product [Paramecium pentaurelia]
MRSNSNHLFKKEPIYDSEIQLVKNFLKTARIAIQNKGQQMPQQQQQEVDLNMNRVASQNKVLPKYLKVRLKLLMTGYLNGRRVLIRNLVIFLGIQWCYHSNFNDQIKVSTLLFFNYVHKLKFQMKSFQGKLKNMEFQIKVNK